MSSKSSDPPQEELGDGYQRLVERAPWGVYLAAPGGRVRACNDAFARMLGYRSPAEVIAADHPVLRVAGEGTGARPPPASSRDGGVEVCLLTRDGGRVHVLRADSFAEDGELLGGTLVALPVDPGASDAAPESRRDRRAQSDALGTPADELLQVARKMEAVSRLAGQIAHDFNNVLAVILSYAGLVLDELSAEDPNRKDVEEIRTAAQRAATLTRRLRILSRREIMRPAVLDLNERLSELGRALQEAVGDRVEVALVLGDALRAVHADPAAFEQVLLSLAANAFEAMPDGGRLTVETSNVEVGPGAGWSPPELAAGSYVRVSVSDTGWGMSDDVRSRAFEPYFSTKPRGKGTGLGLAIVYGVIKQSAGHVELTSKPGEGTRVDILLPATTRRAAVLTTGQFRALRVALRGRGETILVAEDEEAVRQLTSRILTRAGYAVLEAADGDDAVRVSATHGGTIELLLTDVVMPRMGGKELADRLVALRPGLRVLFMSGFTGDLIAQQDLTEDRIALLQKPFTEDALLLRVRSLLDEGVDATLPAPATR